MQSTLAALLLLSGNQVCSGGSSIWGTFGYHSGLVTQHEPLVQKNRFQIYKINSLSGTYTRAEKYVGFGIAGGFEWGVGSNGPVFIAYLIHRPDVTTEVILGVDCFSNCLIGSASIWLVDLP